MNVIHLAGHLGNDPEERFTPSGQKVVSFRLAVRTRKKGQDETIWYRVTVWGDRFDKLVPHLKKGTGVIVIGELQKPEIFTNRDGQPQVGLEVTAEMIRFSPFGKPASASGAGPYGQAAAVGAVSPRQPAEDSSLMDESFSNTAGGASADDDLPF